MGRDDRLIFLLGQARHRLMTNLDRSLLDTASITTAQSGALFYLMENNGCLLRELSKALMLDNSAITGMVDRLENKNFVERRTSSRDRRAINVYLTDKGLEAATKALSIARRYNNTIMKGFSSDEIDVFRRILQSIIDRFG
ncbi:MAG: MarR family transcriptional regulator [Pseudomonadota bacterium]